MTVNPQQDRILVLDTVRDMVEQLISLTGMQGNAVHIVRHVLMALIAVFLAWLAELLCRRVLLPVVLW